MLSYVDMTKTLDVANQQVKALPEPLQEELAEIILSLAGIDGQMPVIAF
jgi:hypothetical protein